jgi:hypothetical protein
MGAELAEPEIAGLVRWPKSIAISTTAAVAGASQFS